MINALSTDDTDDRLIAIHDRLQRLQTRDQMSPDDEHTWHQLTAEARQLTQDRAELERAAEIGKLRSAAYGIQGETRTKIDTGYLGGSDYPHPHVDAGRTIGRVTPATRTALQNTDHAVAAGTLPARAAQVVDRLVRADTTGRAASWAAVTGDPAYTTAVMRVLADPQGGHRSFSTAEQAAWEKADHFARAASLTDGAGGFMVPFHLDPAIHLTAGTTGENFRSLVYTRTTVSDVWNGVNSAGVTASWDAESSEVSDDAPTLTQPSIPVRMWRAFIPFSIEVGQDATSFAGEMTTLLADAALRLHSASFISGAGGASNTPQGIVTGTAAAAGSRVTSATADTVSAADVYALKAALPGHRKANATFLANDTIYDTLRQATNAAGSFVFPELRETPPTLAGIRTAESSDMPGALVATTDNDIMILGDLRAAYVWVDRVGTSIELVQNLFGATGRPTGQRGFFAHGRAGGGVRDASAIRILRA